MARLFTEDFEGGTVGAAVTTANSAFTGVDANITFNAEGVGGGFGVAPFGTAPFGAGGTLAAQVAPPSSAARALRYDYPAGQSLLFQRFYVYLTAVPASVFTFAQVRGGGAVRAELRITSSGALVLRNGNSNVLTGPTVPTGQWMRVEWRLDLAAGQQQVRLFYGADLHGTTVSYDTGNRTYNTGSVDQLRLGVVTAELTPLWLDAVASDNATWVGPPEFAAGGPSGLTVASSTTGTSVVSLVSVNNTLAVASSVTGTSTVVIYGIPVPPPSVLRRTHDWVMFARGVDYAPTVPLPILTAQIVVKHVGVGKAVATTPFTQQRWAALGPGNGLTVWRDGRQEFTGLVSSREMTWDSDSGRAAIQVECEGDEAHLADRPVFPDPLRAADDQTVSDRWSFTGTASAAMLRLLSDQAGPTCRPDRQVTGLTLGADPGRGPSRKWTALFDSDGSALGTLAAISVASGANLGVRMTTAAGVLRADIAVPRNLSSSAVFSADLNNLVGFKYRETVPEVTHALAAGQGDLKARARRLAVSSDPLALQWRRQRWKYVDRRDVDLLAELSEAAADTLAEGAPTVSLAVTLRDSDAATYGTDWGLGDQITIYVGLPEQIQPAVVSDVVREIAFEVSDSTAEKITPAVGSPDATALPASPSQRQLARVGAELANLKARK